MEEFLAASEEEVYTPLASPHGYTLAPEQQSAWRLQLPVLRAALEDWSPRHQPLPSPFFPKNACRVLLTRPRQGMVIFVPPGGNAEDSPANGTSSRIARLMSGS